MKTLIKFALIFFITIWSLNIFPQSKHIDTGLYLVASADSCSEQNNKNTIVFISDTLCLEQNPIITVKDIESFKTETSNLDGNEMYVLNIKLKEAATLEFKKITGENVGKEIAMVINNKVVLAAVVRDPITSGTLTISGESEQVIKEWAKQLDDEIGKR
jgi:preprotein translocase subunit SecD